MSRYKYTGIFLKQRTERKWIVSAGGEEFPFGRKKLAVTAFLAARRRFPDARLLERTTLYFKSPAGVTRSTAEPFDIDITYQLCQKI